AVQVRAKQNVSNRGLINSNGLTRVEAGQELLNTGTGRIYGNYVALAADSLKNLDEGQRSAVIAARERLDIGAAKILNKTDRVTAEGSNGHSKILSEGSLAVGGKLNQQNLAEGKAETLDNLSADIESAGDMSIAAGQTNNRNLHIETAVEKTASKDKDIIRFSNRKTSEHGPGDLGWNLADQLPGEYSRDQFRFNGIDNIYLKNKDGSETHLGRIWIEEKTTEDTYETVVKSSDPAVIRAGGGIAFDGNLHNLDSTVIAGRDVSFSNGKLNNDSSNGTRQVHRHGSFIHRDWYDEGGLFGGGYTREDIAYPIDEKTPPATFALPTTTYSINQTVQPPAADIAAAAPAAEGKKVLDIARSGITLPTNSLYTVNPHNKGWLVETDPAFANYRQWLGSDYMLRALSLDPANTHKRLGDGYYEQRLVNEQINRLTGFRRLDGYQSDEEQFKALMNSGVTAAKAMGLTPGIALTAEQVARLTADIVWLETQTVTLPDGSTQTVLVPKVYVVARSGDLNGSGSLISADSIRLNIHNGTVKNGGTIGARQVVAINARDIENSGQLQADKIGLQAENAIRFNGGTAQADSLLNLKGRDIALNTGTASHSGQTVVDRVAAVYVRGNGQGKGILNIQAENDLTLNAANISNTAEQGISRLSAQNNLNLGTVRTEKQERYGELSDKTHHHFYRSEESGTNIQTKGDVRLSAGKDLNIRQGALDSRDGTVGLAAGNNLNIREGRQTSGMDVSVHTESDKFLSSSEGLSRFSLNRDEAVGSEITGKRVQMSAGKNISVRGSDVIADDGPDIRAGGKVSLTAAENRYTNQDFHQTKKSGLMSSDGGIGFSIGRKSTTDDGSSSRLTHTGSTVGSLKGDTFITGKQYEQTGSSVYSPEGDTVIQAQSLNIRAAANRYTNQNVHTEEKKGLTLAVNVPIVQAVQSLAATAKTVGQSKNDRVNAMAAANTAWEARQAGQQLAGLAGGLAQANGVKDLAQAAQVSVSLTYGEQKNRNETASNRTEALASSVRSGGKTTLIATGAGKDSDITVTGSDIIGKGGTALIAEDELRLQSAVETAGERSSNKSTGWNAGVAASYGSNGMAWGITAGGNYGKGHGNGDSTTHRHSQIGDAGSQTTLQSGGKTTIKGAQVLGKGVALDAKDLDIHSVQDTATYESKQKNIQGQVTVGYGASASGSFSKSNINADYAGVSKQSGILAGEDGFNVQVKGHTDLKGGLITAAQSAEAAGKNQFSTGTLSHSDIENHSQYKGKSFGLSGGVSISGESLGQGEYNPNGGLQKVAGQNGFNKSIGYGKDGDSQSSVTRSGIGTDNIRIGDDGSGEQAKAVYTDTTTENAAARSGSLENNFDAGKVQSELDLQRSVSQSFNQNTQQISTQINANVKEHFDKAKELEKQASDAVNNGERQLAQQLADQAAEEYKTAENWQLAGVGVNMVAAGLSAPTDSAGGIAAATLSPAASYKIGQDFKKLAQANADGKLTGEQQAAHVLAHTVLGAAVAAAGGNDPLAGGISAGGAEYLAPKVSQFLYGTDDPEKLTAEQKDTVANIMSLAGAGVGAAVGGSSENAVQGSLNAESAVENNELVIFPEYKNGRPVVKPQSEKGVLGVVLEKLMPATMSGVVRDKREADTLREIAKLRSEVTGPLVLTTAYSPYIIGAVVVSPEVFAVVKTACITNPVACTELGIGIAEVGAGVPIMNYTNLGNVARNVVGQVKYGNTDLSRLAINYAKENGITGGRNVAVFEYIDLNGKIQTIIKASERGKGHAERLIAMELQNKGIPNSNVTRIYSELEPCSAPGGYCSNMIKYGSPNGLGPYSNAKVTYSFSYGGNPHNAEAARQGVDALRKAREQQKR
ncbi:hemagglutinin repeat-containing protein, partial [Conchiformibius steedae]